ncbi:MAG: hypothetical protein D6695_07820 [Planctomycetota bacterium]|nr:MAG: hypothetical protein D6695_07820 [Planctomycetota bacterium]
MSDLEPVDAGRDDDMPASSRSASMQLRDVSDRDEAMMDPANQSLAEALRITYSIVQAAMVVLALLFVFSGIQRIDEGERGIPLLFGRPTAEQLDPGLHFSAPFPIGEIVKVDATTSTLGLMSQYWPGVREGQEEMAIDKLAAVTSLTPGVDGSLVSADLNVAHAQWRVEYRRVRHRQFAENILPDAEKAIVTAVVQRGIVRVVAETSIDNLLKAGESEDGTISSRIKEIAQRTLDEDLGAGIVIDKVTLYRKTAPIRLRPNFASVQGASSKAKAERDAALRERDILLQQVAGEATNTLIELIQRYESAVELEQVDRAGQILATINAVLEGRPAEFEDIVVPEGLATGEVTEIISQARSLATQTRELAEADLKIFNAKVAQFEANPTLMLYRDWVSAYQELTGKPFLQTMLLPEDALSDIRINADPSILKEMYRDTARRQVKQMREQRTREIEERRFESEEGIRDTGG